MYRDFDASGTERNDPAGNSDHGNATHRWLAVWHPGACRCARGFTGRRRRDRDLLVEELDGTDDFRIARVMNSAQAFIAFLQCEAGLAEERARSLRATAAAIQTHAEIGELRQEKNLLNLLPSEKNTLIEKRKLFAYSLSGHR